MRIYSWNINGIRAACRNGFADWLAGCGGDVVCIQELRALPEQVPAAVRDPDDWQARFQPADKKGYSGVATWSRVPAAPAPSSLGVAEFDDEGRVLASDLGDFVLFNVYFPNGSGKRDNSRVPFKLAFYRRLFEELAALRASGREVIVLGDFNTAHRPIDLARPKANEKTSGFLPEEREELTRWLDAGFVDTFRAVRGDVDGAYTWWTFRSGARERNVGWRIDYILVTPGLAERVTGATIHADVMGSDHCPISVDIRAA